ncbi:MAG: M55 family metallopeptidase [Vampirovibrionales bacterium]|nr:M55 family metallopeptidase [Vampirovibrionales bacterium]
MTRLYVSADLEGVCGVNSPHQCAASPARREAYDAAVAQLALEVATVCKAALAAGAREILVNDAHMTMTNLALAHLPGPDSRIRLLSGKPKPAAMLAGLDLSIDGVVLLGYHAKAGSSPAVLPHTFHDKLADVRVNGLSLGEGGFNAYYASLAHQAPVILASGDQALCREITALIPAVRTVETKTALGYAAALHRSAADVLTAYRETVTQLMADCDRWRDNLLEMPGPYTLEVTVVSPLYADLIMVSPDWIRLDGVRVRRELSDFSSAYLALQSAYATFAYEQTL